ncbi:MAG: flagellar biosynthesis protein FliQ [Gammaproteobacteria bacterium]|nr:flagellar biosynthesis protein FliQ [Gammaproteobacteria bacterium]
MTPESTLDVFQYTVQLILIMVSTILIPALVIGLLVSMFQAATQINEMTLSFVPKLLVVVLTLMISGPWLLRLIVDYTQRLFHEIPILLG